MMLRKKIDIDHLIINVRNPRHKAVNLEQKAMKHLIDEDVDGMYNLAYSIANYGYFPTQVLSVIELSKKKGFYVLLDGNRRMTAVKALINSDKILSDKQYTRLNKLFKALPNKEIENLHNFECVVYDRKEDAIPYLLSIHTDDTNYPNAKKWNRMQQNRFKEEVFGEVSFAYKVIKKNLPTLDITKIKNLSTIERILNTKEIKNDLLKLDKEGNSKINSSLIKRVLTQIIEDIINVITININGEEKTLNTRLNKNDRIEYVKKVMALFINPKKDLEIAKSLATNTIDSSKKDTAHFDGFSHNFTDIGTSVGVATISTSLKEEVPDNGGLKFEYLTLKTVDSSNPENHGILDISRELKKLSNSKNKFYKEFPISTAILIRGLLEQSIKYLIKKRGEWGNLKSVTKKKEGDIGLKDLINFCNNYSKNIFLDSTTLRLYKLFTKSDANKDYFDLIVHHPEKVKSHPEDLERLTDLCLFGLINAILNE